MWPDPLKLVPREIAHTQCAATILGVSKRSCQLRGRRWWGRGPHLMHSARCLVENVQWIRAVPASSHLSTPLNFKLMSCPIANNYFDKIQSDCARVSGLLNSMLNFGKS